MEHRSVICLQCGYVHEPRLDGAADTPACPSCGYAGWAEIDGDAEIVFIPRMLLQAVRERPSFPTAA